jgi:hypothetical protein
MGPIQLVGRRSSRTRNVISESPPAADPAIRRRIPIAPDACTSAVKATVRRVRQTWRVGRPRSSNLAGEVHQLGGGSSEVFDERLRVADDVAIYGDTDAQVVDI